MDGYDNVGEALEAQRRNRLKELRQIRAICIECKISPKDRKKLISPMPHIPPHCRKPTIANYLNLSIEGDKITHFAYTDKYGESWKRRVLLVDRGQTDEEAICEANLYSYYRGAGQAFAHDACVERNGHSILLTQTGGLDI